jgi:hypothetical protein
MFRISVWGEGEGVCANKPRNLIFIYITKLYYYYYWY